MKLAFSTLACPQWSWEDILAKAKRFGYDGIELRFIRDQRDLTQTPEFPESNFTRTKRQLADAGLEIPCVDTSCRLTTADNAALELAQRHIELAAALDCPCVRIYGGELLADYAQPLSVRPLIETHDSFAGSSRIIDLINATAHENLGEPVRLTYVCLREYIHHVHIKDSAPLPDKKYRYPLLREGNVPVARKHRVAQTRQLQRLALLGMGKNLAPRPRRTRNRPPSIQRRAAPDALSAVLQIAVFQQGVAQIVSAGFWAQRRRAKPQRQHKNDRGNTLPAQNSTGHAAPRPRCDLLAGRAPAPPKRE
jgi:sugar phosphate isomerase/epimerase